MKTELAIKFGSNEIIVYRKGFGIVARQPSCVATKGNKVYAFGEDAKRLCALKGDQYKLKYPIQGIDIINKKLAHDLMDNVLDMAMVENGSIYAIVAVPCALTEKKLLELKVLLHDVGIGKVIFIQNAVCVRSTILGYEDTDEVMMVDIGKYLMDISVTTRYQFIKGRNYLIGGAEMDKALSVYVEDNFSVVITDEQAEKIKDEVATMFENDMYTTTFDGLVEGEYKSVTIRANEGRVAIIGVYEKMFDLIEEFMDELQPQTLAEIRKNGIIFTGGVSSVQGLTEYATKRLNIPVKVIDNPKDAVILGAGKLLSLGKEQYPYIKL